MAAPIHHVQCRTCGTTLRCIQQDPPYILMCTCQGTYVSVGADFITAKGFPLFLDDARYEWRGDE